MGSSSFRAYLNHFAELELLSDGEKKISMIWDHDLIEMVYFSPNSYQVIFFPSTIVPKDVPKANIMQTFAQ